LKKQQHKKQNYKSPALKAFIYGITSPVSQEQYPLILKQFFNYIALPGNTLDEQANAFTEKMKKEGNNELQWIQDSIIDFVSYNKRRVLDSKDITAGTLKNYVTVIKLFCETNDDIILGTINWKKITRGLPKAKTNANDRTPTKAEIRKLLEYPDRRLKPIVLVMCSSGIRLGAWENLNWKHVEPIKNDKDEEVIAAKLTVYDGDSEEYYTFMTPEAFHALKSYMDFRASLGESINENSPLIRDALPESNIVADTKRYGFITKPQRLGIDGIKKILIRALWAQGLRKPLPQGVRRFEFKLSHGMRKFFETAIEETDGIKPINVARLMNHRSGIAQHYRRPVVKQVLEDYLKVVDSLTIYDDKIILQKQVAKTTLNETESLKKTVAQMAVRQSAIESILKKIIADEQDWNPNDPHEKKRIDETFQRIIAPNSDFFGE
jgi:integrase